MIKLIRSFFSLLFLIGFTASVSAADYNLRMTMNSNDQDEDYDGAVVFKYYSTVIVFILIIRVHCHP